MKTETNNEKPKHTPGPWKAIDAIVNNAPNRAIVQQNKWGGEVVSDCGVSDDRTTANARLISAAPDLLESLRGMVRLFEQDNDNPDKWVQYRAALSSIAKAEGRE